MNYNFKTILIILFRLETDIIRYAKVIWDDLQVEKLNHEAPDWDKRREKIIDVLQSNKSRFQQYEKNGNFLKLWGLFDADTVNVYSTVNAFFVELIEIKKK